MSVPVVNPGSVEWLDARLERKDLVTIPALATAADVDSDVVQGWIDAGEIEGVDLGSARQHYWKLSRPSILAFWARRQLGIRQRAARRLPQQQELFSQAPSGAGPLK